eukprot:5259585-Amphidinium_carterae.2
MSSCWLIEFPAQVMQYSGEMISRSLGYGSHGSRRSQLLQTTRSCPTLWQKAMLASLSTMHKRSGRMLQASEQFAVHT